MRVCSLKMCYLAANFLAGGFCLLLATACSSLSYVYEQEIASRYEGNSVSGGAPASSPTKNAPCRRDKGPLNVEWNTLRL
jgi:hypothetical protein